uniref:coiled-coil domain-containing protein 87 n=1 Tax=Jaculus jaculus TaxID=51337 RepID=UPI001E1B3E27|nr:coiled-coil domain-containing protein 87 [Jaculus jaculus]
MEPHNQQETELQQIYHRLLSPLSLFPRRATPPEPPKRRSQEAPTRLQSVQLAKLRVAPLCRLVAKRLAGCALSARVTPEDRRHLTEVILDELKCSWRDPPAEPSLDYENNQKLRKRIESYVLTCSEQLFVRYLHLLVTLPSSRGVFTEAATLNRLAVHLARDCTVFLTAPEVYRCLLADFQALLNLEQTGGRVYKARPVCPTGTFKLCPIPWPHSTGFSQVPCSSLNLNYLIQLSRPQDIFSEPEPDPVTELKSIPVLKSRKPLRWLSSIKKVKEMVASSHPGIPTSAISRFPTSVYTQLQRGQSMPCLREGWKLADELDLPPLPSRPLTPLVLAEQSKPELTGYTAAEDLKNIKSMRMDWTHYSPLDSGLPPLLGVLTRRLAAEQRMEDLQKMLKKLQEEEASGEWDVQPPKSSPLHPQPVTTTFKLRNQVAVQVAAVRLSDRNFLDSFHVEGAGVLYNHLTGELDPRDIKEMDIDCHVSNSTKEVYKELMSRVSTDHLRFDQGPLVEPAVDKDLSTFLSSSLLYQSNQNQVINPNLAGLYSRRAHTQQFYPEKLPSLSSLQQSKGDKRTNIGTWMSWWKSSMSLDDYVSFLATQETDFLHAIFQMCEEEAPIEVSVPVKKSVEIQRPPPLQENEEPDFVPGVWDWSSGVENKQGAGKIHIPSLQKRLEQLWSMLEVPDNSRLDMVIKYSSNARLQQLPALVRAWERALKPIQTRELWLGRLEWFERQASDPNRFFQKPSTVLNRLLEESTFRNFFHKKLNLMESSLVSLLKKIELVFGEPVTFKGRRYLDKMKQDRVEMLYWLQQQRRVRHLTRARKTSQRVSLFKKSSSSSTLIVPGNSPITF